MSKKNHVTGLASTLTSGVEGLKPDGPFLVRVAVLVRDFICCSHHLTNSGHLTANGLCEG